MCARATLTNDDLEEVADALSAEVSAGDASQHRRRWNIAPTDVTWIVTRSGDRRVLRPAAWGYQTARGRPLINVRGEPVAAGKGFRDAFVDHRCAMVVDGFYEWPGPGQAPFWFHRTDGGLLLLAGLFQGASDPGAPPRFTVLTTRPNQLIAPIHDRMPVIVPESRLDEWLTAEPRIAAPLIAPAPEDALIATPVSKRANSVRNDDAACIAPAAHPVAPQQGSLF
jgi:putative SOS response-associated peptidase YedK